MDSGIPGVGGRIRWTGGPRGLQNGYIPLVTTQPMVNGDGPTNFNWNVGQVFELVKTGPMKSGNYSLAKYWLRFWMAGEPQTPAAYLAGVGGASLPPFTVKQNPTCSVSSPLMQVPLGSVSVGKFSGMGSTSPPSQLFNIQLTCSGGDSGNITKVSTTLTDPTNPANQSDTLSLRSGSTASGVGIQVLSGTTVIKYGPDTNQWSAGSTGNGTFNIPLTAR